LKEVTADHIKRSNCRSHQKKYLRITSKEVPADHIERSNCGSHQKKYLRITLKEVTAAMPDHWHSRLQGKGHANVPESTTLLSYG